MALHHLRARALFGTPLLHALFCATALIASASAQAPPGYYATVDASSPSTLRSTLHQVIDDHLRFPYTSGGTDTWDVLELAQQDPNNSNNVLTIYRNGSHPKQGGGNSLYEREHTWPKSYGFPDDNPSNYPYTDCHMLRLSVGSYNQARSNKPFRTCAGTHQEWPSLSNNGQGGGQGAYPGNSNWTAGSFTQGTWEVWTGRRGDIARAMMYADVRYEGGSHGVTGAVEPNLILTDVEGLIAASQTGQNITTAYMGMLTVLLQWHTQDPVDAYERRRNDVVYGYQGNRNPFVDHPEWVECLFNGVCAPGVTTYCTAKVNSCGTTPQITHTGASSASSSSGFAIIAPNARANKAGLLIYTDLGVQFPAAPFGQGGFLCISGVKRGIAVPSGGTGGQCNGTLQMDMNAFAAGALGGNPKAFLTVPGTKVNCQWWGRDTLSHGALLSDALEYTVGN